MLTTLIYFLKGNYIFRFFKQELLNVRTREQRNNVLRQILSVETEISSVMRQQTDQYREWNRNMSIAIEKLQSLQNKRQ